MIEKITDTSKTHKHKNTEHTTQTKKKKNRIISAMLALFPNVIFLFPSNISVKKNRKIHSPTPNFFCAICGKNLPYMIKFRISTQIEIGMLTGLEAQNASTNLKVWGSNPHAGDLLELFVIQRNAQIIRIQKLQLMAKGSLAV